MPKTETPTPVRDRCASPVNLDTMEHQEVLAWCGEMEVYSDMLADMLDRLNRISGSLVNRFPKGTPGPSDIGTLDHLCLAQESLQDDVSRLTQSLAARVTDGVTTRPETAERSDEERATPRTLVDLLTGDTSDLTAGELFENIKSAAQDVVGELEVLKGGDPSRTDNLRTMLHGEETPERDFGYIAMVPAAIAMDKAAEEKAKSEAPADQDTAEEPTPATESPKPAEPETEAEDDGDDPDIHDIYVVRFTSHHIEPRGLDDLESSHHCDDHDTLAIHVFRSKLDADRLAAYVALEHQGCQYEVLQGRMVIDWDRPLSETRSVVVPAGTDPDAAVIPISQHLADRLDEEFGSGRKTPPGEPPAEPDASA